jgi:putative protease
MYNTNNYLNTEIIKEIPDFFSGFLIDLRDVETETKTDINKAEIIRLFESLLDGNPDAESQIKKNIHPVTNRQYIRGL